MASLDTVETFYPPLVSCPYDINKIIDRAENAVSGKYRQLGELAVGSAIELPGTIITPFGAQRGGLELNAFENALFLWEAAQQHACTTYQALLQTPLTVPAVGKIKQDACGVGKVRAGDSPHRAATVQRIFAPERPRFFLVLLRNSCKPCENGCLIMTTGGIAPRVGEKCAKPVDHQAFQIAGR